jgi:hypothetical protein
MKQACSWCGVTTAESSGRSDEVTHSICVRCIVKIDEQIAERERKREKKENRS